MDAQNTQATHITQIRYAPPMPELTRLWHYQRPKLAARLLDRALQQERVALFGPRQTGKTSLLREELIPLARDRGALAVYIECWADKTDPLGSINYALTKALDDLNVPDSPTGRKLRRPVTRVGALGATLQLGEPPKRTLPASKFLQIDALITEILAGVKGPVVLVFDEFQAIATGADADAASAALRAALTQASKRVGAIFSGSSEVLLLETFSRARAPLYGFASPEPYPLLGEDFAGHVARKFRQATTRELPLVEAMDTLALLGHQPEPFLNAVNNMMANPKWSLADGLRAMLDPQVRNKWTINWFGLTALQQCALRLVFEEKPPTARDSLAWVAGLLGGKEVAASSITRALEALVDKGLVARDLLGGGRRYVVGDPVMAAWLRQNQKLLPVPDDA